MISNLEIAIEFIITLNCRSYSGKERKDQCQNEAVTGDCPRMQQGKLSNTVSSPLLLAQCSLIVGIM